MRIAHYKAYSHCLSRDMEFLVYGHAGAIMLTFPSQNGRYYDYANNGMLEGLERYIDEGRLIVVACDSIDEESWSALGGDEGWRIGLQEAYFHYITDELTPKIHSIYYQNLGNDGYVNIFTTGCSMGATHALNFFLRRPDLYHGVIALSGVYHATFFFPNYQDPRIYDNSITDYLPNLPYDHPYVDLYRNSKIVLCVGQGRWEDEAIADTRLVEDQFKRLGVDAFIDYWGYDTDHDWPFWRRQIPYFIQFFI